MSGRTWRFYGRLRFLSLKNFKWPARDPTSREQRHNPLVEHDLAQPAKLHGDPADRKDAALLGFPKDRLISEDQARVQSCELSSPQLLRLTGLLMNRMQVDGRTGERWPACRSALDALS